MISRTALRALLAGALVMIASPALLAKGFEYSYVDAGYEYVDGDDVNFKLAAISASFDLFDYAALRAGFKRGKLDNYSRKESDPDFTEFQLGARGHYSLLKNLDAFVGATWFYNSINGDKVASISDGGGIFDAGIRYKAFKRLELNAWGRYRTGDYDDTVLAIGPIIKLTKKLSLNLKTSQFGDNDVYFAGLRLEL